MVFHSWISCDNFGLFQRWISLHITEERVAIYQLAWWGYSSIYINMQYNRKYVHTIQRKQVTSGQNIRTINLGRKWKPRIIENVEGSLSLRRIVSSLKTTVCTYSHYTCSLPPGNSSTTPLRFTGAELRRISKSFISVEAKSLEGEITERRLDVDPNPSLHQSSQHFSSSFLSQNARSSAYYY